MRKAETFNSSFFNFQLTRRQPFQTSPCLARVACSCQAYLALMLAAADASPCELDELLARCLCRDPAAQRALYERYAGRLLGVARRYAGPEDEAEDILQDAFVKIFTHLGEFRAEGSLEGWLRRGHPAGEAQEAGRWTEISRKTAKPSTGTSAAPKPDGRLAAGLSPDVASAAGNRAASQASKLRHERQKPVWGRGRLAMANRTTTSVAVAEVPASTQPRSGWRRHLPTRAVSNSVYMIAAMVKPVFRIVLAYPFCSRPNGFFQHITGGGPGPCATRS